MLFRPRFCKQLLERIWRSIVYKLVYFFVRFYKVPILNYFQVQCCEDSIAPETYLRCEVLIKFETCSKFWLLYWSVEYYSSIWEWYKILTQVYNTVVSESDLKFWLRVEHYSLWNSNNCVKNKQESLWTTVDNNLVSEYCMKVVNINCKLQYFHTVFK